MSAALDETHDPRAQSWLEAANAPETDFPLQNLPFGRFRTEAAGPWRVGVAIGDRVLDVAAVSNFLDLDTQLKMNLLMQSDQEKRKKLRIKLFESLSSQADSGVRQAFAAALRPLSDVELGLPCEVGDYTDFYVGIHHATAVGRQFRPDNPLLPNYQWVPIGYHGRCSSLLASGASFRRPCGQVLPPGAQSPVFAPSQRLDLELELGLFIGQPSRMGEAVPMQEAEQHLFGITLFNDWSARDLQAWEYQPLGPFLAKNFASTVSPWMVTMEALEPFRLPFARPAGAPQPLPHLDCGRNRTRGAIDIRMEVVLQTARMAQSGHAGDVIARSGFAEAAWWTAAQLVAHHSSNGCPLRTGDLLGSGTLSGPTQAGCGSLLELSAGGKQPITLSNGETRAFLEDGDSVVLRGWCEREGVRRIGFGECRGTVLPAVAPH